MRVSKLLAGMVMAATIATPTLALAPAAPGNPAAMLALPSSAKIRAATKPSNSNQVFGLPLIAVVLGVAAAAAITVAATSGNGHNDNPGSP